MNITPSPAPSAVALALAGNIIGHAETAPAHRPADPLYWALRIDAFAARERDRVERETRERCARIAEGYLGIGALPVAERIARIIRNEAALLTAPTVAKQETK